MATERERLIAGPYGEEETRVLYSRYQAMKTRSRKADISFAWKTFSEFQKFILSIAPEGYVPSQYRINFDLEQGGGYNEKSVILSRLGESTRKKEKAERQQGSFEASSNLDVEVIIDLLLESALIDSEHTAEVTNG